MSLKFTVNDYIWVRSDDNGIFSIPFGCKIIAINKNRIQIRHDDGKETIITPEKVLQIMHETSIKGVEDMITLGELQEYSILRNLRLRYSEKLIYTYTGTMLIAVNPYEYLPIYTNELIEQYKNHKIGDLPPHIFAIGNSCYKNMKTEHKSQCIVISGESGAGKTESTKLLLQYLASISGQHSWIEQQILEANPIMEAFGNAKTVRNDNSSRFGKYIDIYFNKNGTIEGALIEQYLLEKSRIVSQNESERNYHIFYDMLAGLSKEEKKKLDLGKPSDYHYLCNNKIDERNEVTEFANIRNAMTVLNFSDNECLEIFKFLAVVLHLGNLQFKSINLSNMESSNVLDVNLATKISNLLGTTKTVLIECLTSKTIAAQGDLVVANLTKDDAIRARDAFAKALYDKLFETIIDKINSVIRTNDASIEHKIGILDIFGFENFDTNSFEQLCINYANENLQQFFVQHIFKMEQQYYVLEGINWKQISYVDNQAILDMIGVKPMNILSLIDEESKFPKGTDITLLSKLHQTHVDKNFYQKPRSDLNTQFGIQHFAGSVFYNTTGFLEKNRDSFSQDVQELIRKSTNQYLKNMFQSDLVQDAINRKTLSSQFRTSLDLLLKNLNLRSPHFIRCIKPNEFKRPGTFDDYLCCRQLRYSGLMETARIRQAGYPIRYPYEIFWKRFYILLKKKITSSTTTPKEFTKLLFAEIFINGEDYQLGKTKIFLKEEQHTHLEKLRNQMLEKSVLILQRTLKGWLYRNKYLKLRKAALTIQKHFRARGFRSRYVVMRSGYQRLQALIKSRIFRQNYKHTKAIAHRFLPYCRGYLIRNQHRFGKVYQIVKQKNMEEAKLKMSSTKDYKLLAMNNMRSRLRQLGPLPPLLVQNDKLEDDRKVAEFVDNEFHFLSISPTVRIRKKSDSENLSETIAETEKQFANISSEEDLSGYDFRKFAATHFLKNINPQHSNKLLRDSLLDLRTPDDIIAAQTIWMMLLRFMGDMAEPKFDDVGLGRENIMSQLSQTIGKSFANRKEFQEIMNLEKNYRSLDRFERQKLINMTLKKRNKLLKDVYSGSVEDASITECYTKWMHRRTSNMDKIHFIVAHGILRAELRDEIFCQICKQLTNNPSKSSHARGWIMLSLCLGCFVPTDRFINYLRAFIRDGPPGYAPFCEQRLNRTLKNGTRTQPPCRLELQAVKSKSLIPLEVSFADKRQGSFKIDSACTARELCQQIANDIKLQDNFGFSLFITTCNKVMSLGSESDHIADAISQCEQYIKELSMQEENTSNWNLFFRKEIFAPWHDAGSDLVATNLIYHQIITGIKYGEYKCSTEGDIATLIAQQYYIDNGSKMDTNVLHTRIGEYLPIDIVKQGDATQNWEKKIEEAFHKSVCVRQKYATNRAKEDIVRYAKMVWPILFSRFFEVVQTSGPKLPQNNLIVAVNSTGICLIDDKEQILLELSFLEVPHVQYRRIGNSFLYEFSFKTIRNEEYVFDCLEAKNLKDLIGYLLDGLKKRSRYCVALRDYQHPEAANSFLTLKRGDLIILKEGNIGETLMLSTWGYGECHRKSGDFPVEVVEILPCTHKPHSKELMPFKSANNSNAQQDANILKSNSSQYVPPYTLSNYAQEHFRESDTNDNSRRVSVLSTVRKNYDEELWKYSSQPILRPLLKKLLNDEDASREACKAFNAILKYTGELAPKKQIPIENMDEIFSACLSNDILKDEIYCQIVKQLTHNRLSQSEERGWELLYLATGLFVPGKTLLIEINKYLKSRAHPFSDLCLKRLQKTQRCGSRKYPPSIVELEAVQHHCMEIYHKIYFPDDTEEAIEIDSTTKAGDICSVLVKRLGLKFYEGFSLFVMFSDRVFSIPESSFFYDFLHELFNWIKRTKPSWKDTAAAPLGQYQVFFMRKLWLNVVPGRDINADEIFHYHQEVPKYLRGFHKCSKEDAVKLAALVYRVRHNEDSSFLNQISASNLKDLIPQHMIKVQSLTEWKKQIVLAYKSFSAKETAKSEFLKTIVSWPTFGSTFFEVKQSTDSFYPEIITVAINKNGVSLIHPHTKDILVTYPFSQLSNWSSGNTFFHLTIGNMMRPTKLLCETSQGYKMDDLITSYTNFLRGKERRTPF